MKLSRSPNPELKKLSHIAKELGTVRRIGLTEQLIEKLESLVLKGVLSPGEQLPSERQLAHLLSVSRASLRQALKVLQVMGVLEVRHGSGNYLSEGAEEILKVPPRILVPLRGLTQAELFEVRRSMEAEAAAAAAERATAKDLEAMRIELNGMKENYHDRVAYGVHDLAFHNAIATASSNRCFIWFLSLANKVLYQALLRRPMPKSMESSIDEHENILQAIEARNPVLARNEMLKHVSYAKYYMLDTKELAEIRFLAYESAGSRTSSGKNHADSGRQ
jgi:GntR family transcriptional regulator, transcriptional repressor for pyruvate dehydrogenase complex